MRNYFLFSCLLIFFNSCQKEVENNIDTSIIKVEFMINRFEQDFYNYTSNESNEVIKARLQKDGYYKSIAGKHFLSEQPFKFHDYNF